MKYKLNRDFIIKKETEKRFMLMNVVSGTVYSINSRIAHLLNAKDLNAFSSSEKSFLLREQIILPVPLKPKYVFNKAVNKTKNALFHLQWHITTKCNLRCKHCYQEEYAKEMSLKNMKIVADKYFEAINKWGFFPEISITGGEPMINKNLFKILQYLRKKERKCGITLLTNGLLINEKNIKEIKRLRISVQISLEGPTAKINDSIRGKGTFDKIIRTIRLLNTHKVPVSVHFVLSNFNKNYLLDTIDLCTRERVGMFSFSRYVPLSPNEQLNTSSMVPSNEIREIYKKVNKKAEFLLKNKLKPYIMRQRTLWCNFKSRYASLGGGCSIGETLIVVMPDGVVFPCRRLPLEIGNILKESFFKIWYSSDLLWKVRNKNLIDGCSNCKHKNICAGCRAIAYSYNHDYLGKDPQCWKY